MSVLAVLFVTSLALLAPLYVVYKPPSLLVRYLAYRWPAVLFRVTTRERVVALTIDDAPSAFTGDILRALSEHNATATFFVIGNQVDEGGKGTLRRVVEQGSELGNHAMRDEPSRGLQSALLSGQIREVDDVIRSIYEDLGVERPGKYFRPGSGFFSKGMLDAIEKLQYRLVLGGIYPHDPFVPYAWINARHILSMVRPGGIIICHDRRSWTVPMLERVLPELRRRGYRVVSISKLLASVT